MYIHNIDRKRIFRHKKFEVGFLRYVPEQKFGAASPYVTAVGGVYMGEIFEEPLQVDPISTGGFSSLSENAIQDYQKDAVTSL